MADRRKNSRTIVLDSSPVTEADGVHTLELSGGPAAVMHLADVDTSVCLSCGEPLAWHDGICGSVSETQDSDKKEITSGTGLRLVPSAFAYNIGQTVQPPSAGQAYVIVWRGQVKVRHPHTGWLHRVNVYWLNNGHWDCYYEEELQVA